MIFQLNNLLLIQHRISSGIVIHFHLAIHLHILATGLDVFEQLVDGRAQVNLLFEQHVELRLTLRAMLRRGVVALNLLPHVIDFKCQNTQTVYSPCRTFGIDTGIVQHLYAAILLTEVAIDLLYQVRTVLMRRFRFNASTGSMCGSRIISSKCHCTVSIQHFR